ncbi:probable disease resistance protein At1g12290 isoform X1 [Cornus florida]|uniref:probable disease resistance protein At1g12290 isoform X1 n=1 Tax=Cornus florida TaxID=4283 RepID=UPI0028990A5C|nr:probable disease resistance protein At1g12290 isoform X1 [Cornus florida]
MEVINTVVGKMVEVLTERFLASMGRRIGYVVHYKKNIEDLYAQVQNLRGVKERIEGKVETAKKNGEVIEKDVLNWLSEVNKKEEDLNRLLANNENIKSCFDVGSRYRLGKEGKKLLSDVLGLIEQASKFDTVGRPAPLGDIWYTGGTTKFEQFESRESVRKQIIQALKNDMIYKIGIHGMGGSGKTRMAEEIAKHAKTEKLFDEVAKAVFSQNPDLKRIQEELADCLELSFKKNTEVGRKGELCNRLKNGKKILVIIDDIWNDKINLEEIGIPSSDNHIKVLLTSREEDVFSRMGVQENIPIGLLQEREAWYLFRKTVGDFIEPSHEVYSVAEEVCRECGCLPLAILVVGAALREQKQKHTWDDARVQLRNCRGENIKGVTKELYSRIKWSYEFLEHTDARSCFLHCSLFPEDAEIPIDDLVIYGVGTRFLMDSSHPMKTARDRTSVLVDNLKKSHLLLEGKSNDFVKMHDIIRDVAISIASKEKGFLAKTDVREWPEKNEYESCRVISLRSKQICELHCELQCAELRTLVLECNTYPKPQVPDNFFKGMKKLEVLDLCSVRLSSSPLNLINLRMLRLYNCELQNLDFLKELRNLLILSIVDSDLKEVAVEVGQLTNLRWLDLSRCENIKIIPSGVIESLSKIEELYIPHNFGEWGVEGNARIDELNSLTCLTTLQIHIGDGMLLPNELCFKSLNRFKISVGRTKRFGYDEKDLGARMLKLDDISMRKEFNILIENAEALFLQNVEGLKNVLQCGDGKGFLDLKYLRIEDSSDMEHLLGSPKWNFQSHGAFNRLSVLDIRRCRMKFLFHVSTARALLQLQELQIRECEIMEEIILDDDEEVMNNVTFHQLKKMELYGLPNLVSICCTNRKKTSSTDCNTSDLAQAFFNEKVSFPALEALEVGGLKNITAIWNNQLFLGSEAAEESSFHQLRNIKILECEQLVNVIIACQTREGEEEITSDEIIVFPHLKNMELECLSKLKSFYGSKKAAVENDNISEALFNYTVSFPALEVLKVRGLKNITAIWNNLLFLDSKAEEESSFHQLRNIKILECEKLVNVVIAGQKGEGGGEITSDEIIVFPHLKIMQLGGLSKLKSFYESKKATVENDIIPQALFNYTVKFPCLESFEYKRCKNNVKEIWDGTVPTDAVCKLRVLKVYDCNELLSVAPSKLLGSFHNLEELSIWWCRSLEEVFKVEGGSNAKEGMVARDTDIEKDSEDNLVFPQLKSIYFRFLRRLRIFYRRSRIYELPSLKRMEIFFCPKLETFPCRVTAPSQSSSEKVAFPVLEDLTLSHMDGSIIFEDILYGHVPAASFSKVRKLQLKNCSVLEDISTLLLQGFEVVEELNVGFCDSLQVVFNLEGLEDIKRGAPEITKLDPYHNLTSLTVESCNSLKCLFSLSIARNLTNIEQLSVSWCNAIEEIIKNEDQGEEDGAMDEIVFPKLQSMHLYDLPNLTSFCWANNAFKLPSLQNVTLKGCDKMQTFTSGQISTPVIKLYYEDIEVSDLNNYVQQRAQERKGIAMYKDDEETSIGKEKESGNHDEEDILANE